MKSKLLVRILSCKIEIYFRATEFIFIFLLTNFILYGIIYPNLKGGIKMMSSRYCKSCGCYIPDDWKICPACFTKQVNEINKPIRESNFKCGNCSYFKHISNNSNYGYCLKDRYICNNQAYCRCTEIREIYDNNASRLVMAYKALHGDSVAIDILNSLYEEGKVSDRMYSEILNEKIKGYRRIW